MNGKAARSQFGKYSKNERPRTSEESRKLKGSRLSLNFPVKVALSFVCLLAAVTLSLLLGSKSLSLKELLGAITNNSTARTILFSLRLPRTILALLSGALLASSGACFQMFFRNSLAEPGIIGISSAATLGAIFSTLVNVSIGSATSIFFHIISPMSVFAFAGALLSGFLISLIASKSRSHSNMTILLCGTALGTFYASVSSIILLTQSQYLHGIYTWILGSFNGRGWNELSFIVLPAAISVLLMMLCANRLDVMNSGEETAGYLGVNISRLRVLVLISSSLAISSSVCAGGTINFVGLIAPHLVRKLFGTRNLNARKLILLSALFGGILVILSDTFARIVIRPSELPAGLITSLLGSPFFVSLLFKKKEDNFGGY